MFNFSCLKNINYFFDKKINSLKFNFSKNILNYIFFLENKFFKIYEKKNIYFRDSFLRCKANFENLRRKNSEEISKAYKYSIEDFSENLLPVVDSLESTLISNFSNSENILEGIRLTLKLLSNVFLSKNITNILPKTGDIFDPHKHLAVSKINCKEKKDNSIVNVLQKGYYISERILRPALVVVNKVI